MESSYFLTHRGSTGMHRDPEMHSISPPHDAVQNNFICSLQWLNWEAEEKLKEPRIPNSVCSLTQIYQLLNRKHDLSIVLKHYIF